MQILTFAPLVVVSEAGLYHVHGLTAVLKRVWLAQVQTLRLQTQRFAGIDAFLSQSPLFLSLEEHADSLVKLFFFSVGAADRSQLVRQGGVLREEASDAAGALLVQ
jgi:hypothetical protein